jgi:hypothetical protein
VTSSGLTEGRGHGGRHRSCAWTEGASGPRRVSACREHLRPSALTRPTTSGGAERGGAGRWVAEDGWRCPTRLVVGQRAVVSSGGGHRAAQDGWRCPTRPTAKTGWRTAGPSRLTARRWATVACDRGRLWQKVAAAVEGGICSNERRRRKERESQVSYSYHCPCHCMSCHTYHLHTTRQANAILRTKQR